MKGTSFHNGVEFKVTIEGESWQQGQAISGGLQRVVRGNPQSGVSSGGVSGGATPASGGETHATANPAGQTSGNALAAGGGAISAGGGSPLPGGNPSPQPPLQSRVILAESTERKIKNKSADAFKILGEAVAENATAWKFTIPRDARITDKAGSLYILYGSGEDPHSLAQLRLNIIPHHYLQDFVELMRTQLRFALKKMTAAKKGWVEVELTPPASKDWAQLDHLILRLQLTVDTIETQFHFHRAEVDAMKAGLTTKLTLREIELSLPIADYVHDFNDRLNKDASEAAVNDVIEEYRSLGWLA